MNLLGRDVLSLAELSRQEILEILDLADVMKRERNRGTIRQPLKNKSLAMIFQKPSTRTRVSFEVAMYELGGHALNLSSSELQLSRGETIRDTGRVLSRYVHAIMARVFEHQNVVELAEGASVPVINALSNLYHPCQILADLQTIREKKGTLGGLKVAWIGDGNNVCNTIIIACAKMGMNVSVATPKKYQPVQEALGLGKKEAEKTKTRLVLTSDPKEAATDADVVVTDTFVSMNVEGERSERLKDFLPRFQVNRGLLRKSKYNCIFMHCLPAHRGEEVTDEVIDGPMSVVWDEAENRLHVQKALLALLLSKKV